MKKKPPLALVVCACLIIGTASNVLAVGAGGTWKFDLGSQTVHQNRALTFDHDGGELTGKTNSEAGAPNFYLFAQHLFK